MIFGIGIDIVQKSRIQNQLEKHGDEFASSVLSPVEMDEYSVVADKTRYLCNHFAAKEAAAKALGTGFSDGVRFHDICVAHEQSGKPLLIFRNYTENYIKTNAIITSHLSISDEKEYSVAMVVLETR